METSSHRGLVESVLNVQEAGLWSRRPIAWLPAESVVILVSDVVTRELGIVGSFEGHRMLEVGRYEVGTFTAKLVSVLRARIACHWSLPKNI